jgi:hypothetical protein
MASVMRFDQWQDSNGVPVATGAGGKFSAPGNVLQVVSTSKTDTFSTTSSTFVDVTGLTLSITPKSTASKIYLVASVNVSVNPNNTESVFLRFNGGNSTTFVGDAASDRVRAVSGVYFDPNNNGVSWNNVTTPITYLDSPSTTSAITYSVQARIGAGTGYVNRSGYDTNSAFFSRTASTITAIEVSA